MTVSFAVRRFMVVSSMLATACSSNGASNGTSGTPTAGTPGAAGTDAGSSLLPDSTPDGPSESVAATEPIPASLQQALRAAEGLDASGLKNAYPAVSASIGYDASASLGLDLVQASSLALDDTELAKLSSSGFVISRRKSFPSFAYGYKSIYAEDLPVYVSADSILEAVHRTFDSLLAQTEEVILIAELDQMLAGMRAHLVTSSLDPEVTQDADLYLALAASLLGGKVVAPIAGADATLLAELFQLATSASGHQNVKLFGVTRDEDFSQFTPRGHYVNSDGLKRYFKAMMWLGRVDLRLIETQGDGSQVFYRRQFDAALALRALLGDTEYRLWQHIDDTIGAFAGEHDNMNPTGLDGLMNALGIASPADAKALTDQQIIDELARGGWGAQRIASRIIIKYVPSSTALPLDRSFALFGQRYTVDSHTFVNVTFDRVAGRMMPEPLDVAFAALGNNAALPLLADEFGNTSYVQGLATTRALVDAHEPAYWEGSVYTRWLGALRSLAPALDTSELPSFAKTSAWQQRILSTQLASWAELRHDTLLYVKQSYTTGTLCEFPDAYVDPYPELYARLSSLAEAVGELTRNLPDIDATSYLKSATLAWVGNFRAVSDHLQKMAQNQVTGTPHSAEQLAFINDAVKWEERPLCGGVTRSNLSGWYLKLYLGQNAGIESAPVVADVHTQPTDEGGADVGRILHVGVGLPRLMVVSAETCQGPRAYVGLASSYGELVTEKWKRLTDADWTSMIATAPFPDPAWMGAVLAE